MCVCVFVCLCVCVFIERIVPSESDSMIEICGKLDKSNTQLKFRCVIFRLARTSSDRDGFLSFSI